MLSEGVFVNRVRSCERIDASRLPESYLFGLVAIVCFAAAFFCAELTVPPMLVLFLGGGIFFASHTLNRNILFRCAQKSYKQWRIRGEGVAFGPCWRFALWSVLSTAILIITAGVMVWMTYFAGAVYPARTAIRITAIAVFLLALAVVELVSFPFGRWTEPEIIVDPDGVLLWPAGRYRVMIRWEERPKVVGCM